MANSEKTFTLKVSEETYNRLTKIKEKYNITYSEVIGMLIEMETKKNYVTKIDDFEFITKDNDGIFRVLHKKDNLVFEYFNGYNYSNKISEWNVDNRTKRLFKKFINDPFNFELLFKVEVAMEFKDFIILRLL